MTEPGVLGSLIKTHFHRTKQISSLRTNKAYQTLIIRTFKLPHSQKESNGIKGPTTRSEYIYFSFPYFIELNIPGVGHLTAIKDQRVR